MEEYDNDNMYIRSEREIMVEILDMYKDLPCLWDVSNQLYKNKQARHNSLEILLDKWKNIDKNITLEMMKRKLENMRTTFLREQKKVEVSKTTGAASADIYKPTLWYYENLMFLIENQTAKRDGVDSIDTEDTSNESVRKSKKNKQQQIDVQSKQIKLLESAEKILLYQEDPTESIAKAMALQLKEMSKLQRCIAEKLISEIMFYGKLDQLAVSSSINLNASRIASYHSPSPVNKNNLQTRRHIYMPMVSPASPSPSQSPASHIYEQTAYNENNNDSCNPTVLSIPEINCRPLPTENQTSSTQQTSFPIGNQSFPPHIPITPQSSNMPTESPTPQSANMPTGNEPFSPQANIIYEGDGGLLKDFLIFQKKPY